LAEITIPLRSNEEAVLVLGPYDRFAKLLRQSLDIELSNSRGNLRLAGGDDAVLEARQRIEHLLGKVRKGRELGVRQIESILLGKSAGKNDAAAFRDAYEKANRRDVATAKVAVKDGGFRAKLKVPADLKPGEYVVRVFVEGASGCALGARTLKVVAPPAR
jgi:phosphate starvation-inducible protein PhoH